MITSMESMEKIKRTQKCLDSQLWHACAGSMVQMPSVNSKVFYFPQGHSEHASGNVDFRKCPKIRSCIPCKVSAIKFMADPETDEVFAKIRLVPISDSDVDIDIDDDQRLGLDIENQENPCSFAKTLTQSDANNGGGFSVPRYCAETIFPRLDYSADPPAQTIFAKDVHGETWKFRHIYRGTPRRHLLTTGWSTFVNRKKLAAGDSIVFLRTDNGELCVGVRRAKRGIGGGPEIPSGWNVGSGNCIGPCGGFSAFLREDNGNFARNGSGNANLNFGGVKVEDVIEAATFAASGRPFDVVYYPRASTPEFCVKASLLECAMRIQWCSGMRFKMAFETEDSSRISWFMGTISSVQEADPIQWPGSPWRLLLVTWDEPDLLQNVKRVNPWLIELVSNIPTLHMSPFPPPKKKMRSAYPLNSQVPLTAFPTNNFFGLSNNFNFHPNNTPAGMQGARHAQYSLSLSNIQGHLALHPDRFSHLHCVPLPSAVSNPIILGNENVSCLLTMGNSMQGLKKSDKTVPFLLFGQPILTEKQISLSCSSSCSNGNNAEKIGHTSDGSGSGSACEVFRTEVSLETGHCEVFMESADVCRTFDLSLLGSYEEVYMKLGSMFGIEISEMLNHVNYQGPAGEIKQLGDEPFSSFMKTAKRLMIRVDSSCNDIGS